MGAVVVGFLFLQLGVFGSGSKPAEDADATELASADVRADDPTASRGGARTPGNVVAPIDVVAPADDPNPTTTTTAAPPAPTPPPKAAAAPKPTAPVAPKPQLASTVAKNDSGPIGDDVWRRLANCEAGGRNDTGAPYYGYFQFSAGTWRGVGGSGLPSDHSYETQKQFAQKLQARSGWGQWPACSQKIGVR